MNFLAEFLLSLSGDLHSPFDSQNFMGTSLSLDTSLVKNFMTPLVIGFYMKLLTDKHIITVNK